MEESSMAKVNECILVSVDINEGGDEDVLVVGRQKKGDITIVNAFQGKEAFDLYRKLVTPKEK
jgi:hypothetical protein